SWTLWLRYFAFQRATTPNFPRRRGGYPNSAALRPPREKHDFVNGLLAQHPAARWKHSIWPGWPDF
ncbi:MAG TPA: hypothetical protein VFG23_03170, partial [Polyangia bacterium]|nr:hypothetical protein [Polyangia bacterium]